MDKQNICNFNFNRSSDLICTKFVLEKNSCQAKETLSKDFQMSLVTEGRGYFIYGGKRLEVSCGDLFFVERGRSFSVCNADVGEPFEYCYICYHGRRAEELTDRVGIAEAGYIFRGKQDLMHFWLDCIGKVNKSNVDLLSESVLLYSLAELSPVEGEQSDLVSRMVTVTNESFNDPDFNLRSLATKIGYGEKYISSVFKKQKGMTYSSYLRDLRISHATFLMERGIVSVKNIAILSGFTDPLYFSKVFKASEGITPKDYIRSLGDSKNEVRGDI